jgi:hypothetical protein
MMACTKRIPTWGIASLVLLVGDYLVWGYSFHLEDLGKPLFSRVTGYEQCVVVQLAATVCGIIAMKRESRWWVVAVIPAAWLALGCFFGEV